MLSRGDRREDIFLNDVDRQDFIETLAECCLKTGFQLHAYCLMPNHFHLVVETPNANLVDGMRWLLSTCSNRLNHRHKLAGHVFTGRYKALAVDGGGKGYLKTACDYVLKARSSGPASFILLLIPEIVRSQDKSFTNATRSPETQRVRAQAASKSSSPGRRDS